MIARLAVFDVLDLLLSGKKPLDSHTNRARHVCCDTTASILDGH